MPEGSRRDLGPIRIEGYDLLERLGHGSMGVVFRARQLSLDRIVAVKILSPRLASNPGYVEWFRKEARTVARLSHPNIISGIDFGEAEGYCYFVMEYVDGPTVADLVQRGGALDEARAVEFLLQIAQALDYAHRNGLVHRDVKPQNIIIAPGGVAKLCDLGLALTRMPGDSGRGQVCGTPDYISPEQVRGVEEIDIRSDLYSLGVTFYFMLVGEVPFPGEGASATMAAQLTRRIPDPRTHRTELSKTTARIVLTLTQKDPRDRYPDPATLVADLRCLVSELTLRDAPSPRAGALPPTPPKRTGGRGGRRKRRGGGGRGGGTAG